MGSTNNYLSAFQFEQLLGRKKLSTGSIIQRLV